MYTLEQIDKAVDYYIDKVKQHEVGPANDAIELTVSLLKLENIERRVEMIVRTVTKAELKANESVGWYVNKGGVVYQVLTLSPRKVRYIGKLKEELK